TVGSKQTKRARSGNYEIKFRRVTFQPVTPLVGELESVVTRCSIPHPTTPSSNQSNSSGRQSSA
ncbi:TPA: hypothetical protein N0F65_012963, partial [Lagenidium giganteum]